MKKNITERKSRCHVVGQTQNFICPGGKFITKICYGNRINYSGRVRVIIDIQNTEIHQNNMYKTVWLSELNSKSRAFKKKTRNLQAGTITHWSVAFLKSLNEEVKTQISKRREQNLFYFPLRQHYAENFNLYIK